MRHHQRGPVHALNHLRHVNVLPDPVTPSSTCVLVAAVQPVHQLGYGLDLVAGQLKVRCEGEAIGDGGHKDVRRHHRNSIRLGRRSLGEGGPSRGIGQGRATADDTGL